MKLINNIRETALLINNSLEIIFINEAGIKLFEKDKSEIEGRFMSEFFPQWEDIKKEVNNLISGSLSSFTCRMELYISNEARVVEMFFTLIRDKFNDAVGIMILCEEVSETRKLKRIHKLSNREIDVIQLLLNGFSNKSIAEKLYISERTVKNHLVNIYNKLQVDNKIQLFNILKEFNILPQRKAEKMLLLIRK